MPLLPCLPLLSAKNLPQRIADLNTPWATFQQGFWPPCRGPCGIIEHGGHCDRASLCSWNRSQTVLEPCCQIEILALDPCIWRLFLPSWCPEEVSSQWPCPHFLEQKSRMTAHRYNHFQWKKHIFHKDSWTSCQTGKTPVWWQQPRPHFRCWEGSPWSDHLPCHAALWSGTFLQGTNLKQLL